MPAPAPQYRPGDYVCRIVDGTHCFVTRAIWLRVTDCYLYQCCQLSDVTGDWTFFTAYRDELRRMDPELEPAT